MRVFSTQQNIVDRQKETRTWLYFINQLTNSSTLRPLRCGACCTTHLHERVLVRPASVVSSCLIYKLEKLTGLRFQAHISPYSLWKFTEFRAETLPCLWSSKLRYPPPPLWLWNSSPRNLPSPSEFQDAGRGTVWIFSRITHFHSTMLYLPAYLFSLDFTYFEALKADIFRPCSIKN